MGLKGFKPTFCNPNYLVNKNGEFYSLKRNRLIKPYSDNHKGYLHIDLDNKTYKAHRVVLQTFKPVSNYQKLQVNHVNNIKNDNRLSNLEWSNQRHNMNHRMNNKKYGVYFSNNKKKYIVVIKVKSKRSQVGSFENKEEAYTAFYNKYLEIHGIPPWSQND